MILYLVVNIEDSAEHFILDICLSRDKAYELQEQYRNNFKEANYDNPEDIIIVEEINSDDFIDEEVIWSCDA